MGKIGSQVDLNEARAAAGAYPDEYMTEDVWLEMQEFMESRRTQKRVLDSDQNKNPVLKYNETRQNINFVGMNYSMHEGIRNTTDSPAGVVGIPHIQIFGGSTVVCEEMPDRLVVTSFLQRMLHGLNAAIRVLNNGASGATTIDRVQMLTQETKLENLDIVIFYFGDNDSGWIDSRSGKSSQQLVWLPVRLLRELSNWGFETARWAYGEFSPRSFRKFSQSAVADTITALNEAHEYCFSKGAHMIAVLQPNLYTLQTKSEYEKKLEKRFSQDIKILVIDAYKQYEAWVKQIPFGVSATHIFDNAPAPVFLDWAHVNARGNELIAKFIFEELKKRKLISVDEEV